MVGNFGATPGITSSTDTPGAPFILAGTPTVVSVLISSVAVDARSSGATHILLPGLTMAMLSSGKKYQQYVVGGSGGQETAVGFLMDQVDMKGPDGVARDTIGRVAIGGQPLIDEAQVALLDAAAKLDFSGAQAAAGPITVVGQACRFLWSSDFGAA